MPQLTIYLDEEALALVEAAARREGCSLSRWARGHLVAAARPRGWPDGYLDLFGSVTDDSFQEPEELHWADDAERVKW